ncbi:MAG: dipeptide epimerase [Stygiobacter sp. RIFOXYC12_FULL_38_8]|nr:MAG: dipeptide epimerase [Stygiobacter sp. GWC2_38_9]OGV06575.1 MAG: dipeptide epimerase [Stygiobacter sp. RIFOXYB2_FULL_37_11]OGV13163.1 MAG: dipeptide epimerase [Stygiobacter sp. RIFOXYC2_FULL_38_25]OGV17009.1 MAG: dipeptide epimerase [Stygiobacter sp. RIFOXYA2_FULL_38_8]OGV29158.1 MAG: dipeptide epimerase [Stygiobacter sp. RIFOXYC12_FULL_38_8]OGV83209.1 MAG: dipeptide epimerase [Stygiobacter sp. GWF2_38_21]
MKQNRRDFILNSGLIGGAILTGGLNTNSLAKNININKKNSKMKLTFKPYTLELKHVFTLATSSRTTTPVMLTQIEYDGLIGYGEASMPPYLGESHESAAKFLAKVDLTQFKDPFELETILNYVDKIDKLNPAAKASVDIALHDLVGKLMKKPWHKIWGYDKEKTPNTSFTIGIDSKEVVIEKVKEAEEYKILKVKLGRDTDKMMIETIRTVTDKTIVVDVNQGWKDKQFALDMIHWLNERNVKMVEQPMPKEMIDENAWLTDKSPLPTFGDESVQRIPDVIKAHGVYSGINIKLMKCTGLREAHKMIDLAKSLNMKVMLGCMTETSCAISAVSQLSSQCEWADMDGALLIKNDPFVGTKVIDGRVVLNDSPGIGISKALPH